jgi:hypothetical protein
LLHLLINLRKMKASPNSLKALADEARFHGSTFHECFAMAD